MHFTPKINVEAVIIAVLTLVMAGWIGLVSDIAPTSSIAVTHGIGATSRPIQHWPLLPTIPAVQRTHPGAYQWDRPATYVPVSSWYKSKHWWKRNAPIVGGAGGGALVGGLVGGGTGALVGGAIGGGGGYLYKRSRHHHHHYQ
jgi:hypothetical protein